LGVVRKGRRYRDCGSATRHEDDATVLLQLELDKGSCERFMALERFRRGVAVEVV
jgi:hypothetical protein